MDLTGKVLADRYEILEEIGVGGMAVVYKAKCLVLNRYVAIKVLRDDLKGDEEFVRRFNVEAQAAASLTHPNIVSIFDVGEAGALHYIVMEYVEGQTLKEYIDEKHELPWREAVDIAMQIAKGLEVAHKNSIVHRDIKPHNIMITKEGNIKVTDFGIARANSQKTMTVEKTAIGSVHYISPEQAKGGFIDHRSDLYSLGIVLYEMLTGRVPFDDENSVTVAIKQIQEKPVPPCEYNISIPMPLEQIVLKAIAKEPSARQKDAAEFYSELHSILNDPDRILNYETDALASDETQIYKPVDVSKDETIIIPKIDREEIKEDEEMSKKSRRNQNDIKIDKNKERKVIVFAVLSALIMIFALLFGLASMMGLTDIIFSGGGNVEVPKIVGMSYDEAIETYKDAGFSIIKVKEVESDRDEGIILSQEPEDGRKIKKNDEMKINVEVSGGAKDIVLDSYLKYTDKRNVELEMKRIGLNCEFIEEESDEIPNGAIIRQYPTSGSIVNKGDLVTFYVSTGPKKEDESTENPTENKPGNSNDETTSKDPATTTKPADKKSTMLTVYGPKDKSAALVHVKVNGKIVYEKNIRNGQSEVVKLESPMSTVDVEILYDGVSMQKKTINLK